MFTTARIAMTLVSLVSASTAVFAFDGYDHWVEYSRTHGSCVDVGSTSDQISLGYVCPSRDPKDPTPNVNFMTTFECTDFLVERNTRTNDSRTTDFTYRIPGCPTN